MFTIKMTTIFKKDVKRAKKRNNDLKLLKSTIQLLEHGKTLSSRHHDHNLIGNW